MRASGYECDKEGAVKCDPFRVINGRDYYFTKQPINLYFSNYEGTTEANIEISLQQISNN